MGAVCLVFRLDPTTGLPRLESRGSRLAPAELVALESEVRRRFERLVHNGSGALVTFETPVAGLPYPAEFQLSVQPGASHRCPNLVFEPCSAAAPLATSPRQSSPAISRAAPPHWSAQFLQEASGLFSQQSSAGLGLSQRRALSRVIRELSRLATERPQALAPTLVAGYLSLGERLAHGLADSRRYASAARGFDLPAGLLLFRPPADRAAAMPRRRRAAPWLGTLRWSLRLVARVLGLGQPERLDV